MAALLKKRALAEFSQTIQETPAPPVKRLRIFHREVLPTVSINLSKPGSNVRDTLQSLIALQDQLPVENENAEQLVRILMECFCKKDTAVVVKVKVMEVLSLLVKTPGFNVCAFADDLLPIVKNETSGKVLAQVLGTLRVVGQGVTQDKKLHHRLLAMAEENLTSTNHAVRTECLTMIGSIGSPEQTSESGDNFQTILANCSHDEDSRVRMAALEALLCWQQRGLKLERDLYGQVTTALDDDYEGVRMIAVKLIWVLSNIYPESPVKFPDTDETLRLVDDGFAKICNMVNDQYLEVRVQAARLLGSLRNVSGRFLEQTLDKKLMSNMRRKESAHVRQKQHYATGEWSTGQKWADDAPKELVQAEQISLISGGACGAFVHNLEDEFLEVRNAAIDSLCELASQSASFARLAQDFLIDMFNDEIDTVRLNAINSLRKMGHHLVIREDQVDSMLGVLKDFSVDIRESMHEMFCTIKLETKSCLNLCILALLDNLKRYPQDRSSIWKCMKHLGRRHPELALPLVPDLLSTHAYFDVPEPDMDDPAYISILILVFNAAVNSATMFQLFPDHTLRHYGYLRDSLPDKVPQLKILGQGLSITTEAPEKIDVDGFLAEILNKLDSLTSVDKHLAQDLIKSTIRDLDRISEMEPRLSATARCQARYLQCLLSLMQVLQGMSLSGAVCGLETGTKTAAMADVVQQLTELETVFLGLSIQEIGTVRQLKLKARTVRLLHSLRTGSDRQALLHQCKEFLDALQSEQKFLSEHDITLEPFTDTLVSAIPDLESLRQSAFSRPLQTAISKLTESSSKMAPGGSGSGDASSANQIAPLLKLTNQIRQMTAVVSSPVETADAPWRFIAGLTLAIPLDAILENVNDIDSIYVLVEYPDMRQQLVSCPRSDFRQLGPGRYRLLSPITVSHTLWSEPSHINLSIVTRVGDGCTRTERSPVPTTVNLCKPIKVYVAPKPSKR